MNEKMLERNLSHNTMAEVYSFDVFDTALIRRVAVPSAVSRLVGERIARESDNGLRAEALKNFVSARHEAEIRALISAQNTECTLDEIWAILRELLRDLPQTCGPQYELDAERGVLAPNPIVANQINELRTQGARIVFASDTALPGDFVRGELIRHGLAKEDDGFYVSSSLGLTKRSGTLFREILKREKVAACDVRHIGDNLKSDVLVPIGLGIAGELMRDTQLNRWERAVLARHSACETATAALAGSMRVARLSGNRQDDPGVQQLVSTFLGPAALVWASWVLHSAQRDGVRRLYFIARDGYLVCRAARLLAPQFGDIDCRYLRISRQSVLLPSANEPTPSEMPWVRVFGERLELNKLVERVGLSWSQAAVQFYKTANLKNGSKILTSEQEWNEFWSTLQSPSLLNLIQTRIMDLRAATVAYLEAEGLYDGTPAAVVDIGWLFMSQMALRKLLNSDGSRKALGGYYLGARLGRIALSQTGKARALFYESTSDRQWLTGTYEIFNRVSLLEHLLGLAPHGTVRKYDIDNDKIGPVCAAVPDGHAELVERIANAIEAFCLEHGYAAGYYAEEATARELLDALIESWCVSPDCAAVKLLAEVRKSRDHQINVLLDDSRPLVEPWRLAEAATNLIPGRWREALGIAVQKPLWPEAALLQSAWLPASLVRFHAIAFPILKRILSPNTN
jgi:predicted HAD superfamily hydrolase